MGTCLTSTTSIRAANLPETRRIVHCWAGRGREPIRRLAALQRNKPAEPLQRVGDQQGIVPSEIWKRGTAPGPEVVGQGVATIRVHARYSCTGFHATSSRLVTNFLLAARRGARPLRLPGLHSDDQRPWPQPEPRTPPETRPHAASGSC